MLNKNYETYLNNLKEWGVVNMASSAPLLASQFPELSISEATDVVIEWAKNQPQLLNE